MTFQTSMDRGYAESLMRERSAGLIRLDPNYVKSFDWDRMYDVRWDLTRALRLEFQATTHARIDEPEGPIDDEARDIIMQNIRSLGRTTFYTHRANLTYNLPLNRLPLVDFINANTSYGADFDWVAAPRAAEDLGNTIENSQSIRLNVNANLLNLYNKVGFLQAINRAGGGRGGGQQAGRSPRPPAEEGEEEEVDRPDYVRIAFERLMRTMMSVRNLSINYTQTSGTQLPGFDPDVGILGQNWDLNAPGAAFLFGSQDDIRHQAAREGWLIQYTDPEGNIVPLNIPFSQSRTRSLTARSQIEPVRDLRIEVTAQRNHALTHREYYTAIDGSYRSFSPMETGSFSISFFALATTFERIDDRTYKSENFENFKQYRMEIAQRLADRNPNWPPAEFGDTTLFPIGYGPTSQDVLIPAFIAAYSGRDPSSVTLNPFMRIPMPNWRVTYDGLSRIPAFRRLFRSFTIGHGYRSTFTIGNFQSISAYEEMDGYQSAVNPNTGNYIPEYEIGQVSISEQFNPLINVDVTWQNNLMTRAEVRRSRDMALSFANNQVTDNQRTEYIIGAGYRFQDLSFNITSGGRQQRIQSDLMLRMDLAIRDNKTILRKLVEDTDVISSGQQSIAINTSAEYQLSPRVNFRIFFDRTVNNPYVSNQFPNRNSHGGFSLRFTLM